MQKRLIPALLVLAALPVTVMAHGRSSPTRKGSTR